MSDREQQIQAVMQAVDEKLLEQARQEASMSPAAWNRTRLARECAKAAIDALAALPSTVTDEQVNRAYVAFCIHQDERQFARNRQAMRAALQAVRLLAVGSTREERISRADWEEREAEWERQARIHEAKQDELQRTVNDLTERVADLQEAGRTVLDVLPLGTFSWGLLVKVSRVNQLDLRRLVGEER